MERKQTFSIPRRLGVLAVFALSAGLLCATTIEVIDPGAGILWFNGGTCSIHWKQDGFFPASGEGNVRIALRNAASTTEIMPIVESTANDGTYDWTVPMDITRKKFVVRVKLIGQNVKDDSGIFFIGPRLLYINPPDGGSLMETNTYTITWAWQGPVPNSSVDIRCQDKARTIGMMTIAENVPPNGSCQWTVPGDIPKGTYLMYFELKNPANSYGNMFDIVLAKPHVPAKVKK